MIEGTGRTVMRNPTVSVCWMNDQMDNIEEGHVTTCQAVRPSDRLA